MRFDAQLIGMVASPASGQQLHRYTRPVSTLVLEKFV